MEITINGVTITNSDFKLQQMLFNISEIVVSNEDEDGFDNDPDATVQQCVEYIESILKINQTTEI